MKDTGVRLIVVGAQWGDEGKGKVVDLLAEKFDIVARYQGGHNAGHTVTVGGKECKFHLVPSGALRGKKCVLGNGMVIDPVAFKREIMALRASYQVFVSTRAHLILPWHAAIDRALANNNTSGIGTTGRGIGPAYEDKAARRGRRLVDVLHLGRDLLVKEVKELGEELAEANNRLRSLGAALLERTCLDEFMEGVELLARYACDTSAYLNRAIDDGQWVLFEGAQGTGLDIDHGTYPYVTSSNATAGGACTGTGVAPNRITGILGVTKAYSTRVGGGPFPTELFDAVGEYLQTEGKEIGASTGRIRRCGWLDCVALREACMLNNFDSLALTKLDVLDQLPEIKVCIEYGCHGYRRVNVPEAIQTLANCEPVYRIFPGWQSRTHGITDWNRLPENAQQYLAFVAQFCGRPIKLISTSPERNETIIRRDVPVFDWMNELLVGAPSAA